MPTDYLAVAEVSRGHPFTTHPKTFLFTTLGRSGLIPNSPSFGLRLPYRSRTPDSSRAARSRPSRSRACRSRVIWRASHSWLSRRDWISLASFRAASSSTRQCSNAGRSSRWASAPASSASQWPTMSANEFLGMTLLLSFRFGRVVLLALRRIPRRLHGGRRRARSLGLAAPADPGRHAELGQGLVGGAEVDHREGLDLADRLAPVRDHLLQLLRDGLSLTFERLLLDLEVPGLGQEPFELGLERIDPRNQARVLGAGPEDRVPIPENVRLCSFHRHVLLLSGFPTLQPTWPARVSTFSVRGAWLWPPGEPKEMWTVSPTTFSSAGSATEEASPETKEAKCAAASDDGKLRLRW